MSVKGARGFSLLEVIVVLGIGAMVSLGVVSIFGTTAKSQARAMELAQIMAQKQAILGALANSWAWKNTIQGNSYGRQSLPHPHGQGNPWGIAEHDKPLIQGMDCLLDSSAALCQLNRPQTFMLYDSSNNIVYDSMSSANGFDHHGQACSSFSMAGNDACPFRYELQWIALCSGAVSCKNPLVLVNGHLYYRPSANQANNIVVNEDSLSINDFYLNSEAECLGSTQQVYFFNNETPAWAPASFGPMPWTATSLATQFVVPEYGSRMIIEMWAGGGGGGAIVSPMSPPLNGGFGGASTFGNAADPWFMTTAVAPIGSSQNVWNGLWWASADSAGGGAGGWASNSWFYACVDDAPWLIPIGDWSPSSGWNGAPSDPGVLNGVPPNSCAAPATTTNAGFGGGFQTLAPNAIWNLGFPGTSYGGGGGSGAANWGDMDEPCFSLWWLVAQGAHGGNYRTRTFTPAQLPPGTVVPLQIGRGGAPALGMAAVWASGAWPIWNWGGAGGPGLIKITFY